MQNRSIISSMALLAATAAAPLLLAEANLSIEVNQPKAAVSRTLYGLMTEEINYSYDGGIYAELVRNRTFRSDWSGILNWYLVEKGASSARMSVDNKTGPSTALTTSAKLEVTKADASSPAGLMNEGYWGIAVRPNTRYTGSLYAKTDSASPLPVKIALVANQSGQVLARVLVQTSPNVQVASDDRYVLIMRRPQLPRLPESSSDDPAACPP
jgi:alpha-L-arabinofuranosidase